MPQDKFPSPLSPKQIIQSTVLFGRCLLLVCLNVNFAGWIGWGGGGGGGGGGGTCIPAESYTLMVVKTAPRMRSDYYVKREENFNNDNQRKGTPPYKAPTKSICHNKSLILGFF